MKKLTALFAITTFFLGGTLTPAYAYSACPKSGIYASLCNITAGGSLISGAITLVFIIAVLVAILYIIYGGFRWIMSSGDKASLQAAREHVVAAIIGLLVVFLVYFFVNLVLTLFGLKGLNWNIPTINTVSGQ